MSHVLAGLKLELGQVRHELAQQILVVNLVGDHGDCFGGGLGVALATERGLDLGDEARALLGYLLLAFRTMDRVHDREECL